MEAVFADEGARRAASEPLKNETRLNNGAISTAQELPHHDNRRKDAYFQHSEVINVYPPVSTTADASTGISLEPCAMQSLMPAKTLITTGEVRLRLAARAGDEKRLRKPTYTLVKNSPLISPGKLLGFNSAGRMNALVRLPNVIVMVGLPARGKTFISRKLCRYLNWIGIKTKVFNVGEYRRDMVKDYNGSDFFDPSNEEAKRVRQQCAQSALRDMCRYLNSKEGQVAIFDATNSTRERRRLLIETCTEKFCFRIFFVESVCDDPAIIEANIQAVKVNSPDYRNIEKERARDDFIQRIEHYRQSYETMDEQADFDLSYVKVINAGRTFYINHIQGHVQSRVVYFLMNIHLLPKSIYLTRHGESEYNRMGRIGGDSPLSDRGMLYAEELRHYFMREKVPDLRIWCSTKVRAVQTSNVLQSHGSLASYVECWKALDEIDAGVCEGFTYKEIEERFPEQFASRDDDKYHYRYPSGESYEDLVGRLEPVIMELEKQENVLIISHQAVIRCLLAYFTDKDRDELPYVKVPLHTVIKLTPIAYGCTVEMIPLNVEATDTHRPKPQTGVLKVMTWQDGHQLVSDFQQCPQRDVIVMVGLPARGKTFISRKLCRYLNWIGIKTKAFNAGEYRRHLVKNYTGADFFDPHNEDAAAIRAECAELALQDMCRYLQNLEGQVGVFDATNSTRDRRRMLIETCVGKFSLRVFFLESVCDDPQVIEANIQEVKINSPDYKHMDKEKARDDFVQRIEHYRQSYETMDELHDEQLSYIQVINGGRSFKVHNTIGHVQSRVVYYLMNCHLLPKSIYFTRHGENEYNRMDRIGGDSPLTERGIRYAHALTQFFTKEKVPDLRIWSSPKISGVQTAQMLQSLASFTERWDPISDINAGICDGFTYNEIKIRYPQQFALRAKDKYHYRYTSGESYEDLVGRLEPVIMVKELEKQENVLIISHQAIIRCLLAYFCDKGSEQLPYIDVPLHTVIKLTPIAYGCKVEMFPLNVDSPLEALRDKSAGRTLFESFGFDPDGSVFCLNMGAPGPAALKRAAALMLEASQITLANEINENGAIMQYGPESGDPKALENLAAFLSAEHGDTIDKAHLTFTAGATSGLYYLLTLLYPNERCPVFVEELTYFIAIDVIQEQLKFPLISVAMEADGISVANLEAAFQEHQATFVTGKNHPFRAVLYLVPTFHNPTGCTLSAAKRRKVVELARKYSVLVVCDDVYDLLYYCDRESVGFPRRLFAYDNPNDEDYQGNVISNGSFAKLLGPGLRLGWYEAPIWFRRLWDKSGAALSGGCVNHYTSVIVSTVLERGLLSQFLVELRAKYSNSLRLTMDILNARLLPLGCHFVVPEGGYFVWLDLPKEADVFDLYKLAREKYNVMFQVGPKFTPDAERKKRFQCCARIAISYYEGERLREGMNSFCASVEEYLASIKPLPAK